MLMQCILHSSSPVNIIVRISTPYLTHRIANSTTKLGYKSLRPEFVSDR